VSSCSATKKALLLLHMGPCCHQPLLREAKVIRMEDPYVEGITPSTTTWTNYPGALLSSSVAQLSRAFLDRYGSTSVERHPTLQMRLGARGIARGRRCLFLKTGGSMTRPRRLRAKVHSTNSRFCRGKVPVACYLRRPTGTWVARRLKVSDDKTR